jgi:predicted transcriptional regulator of viral defense system
MRINELKNNNKLYFNIDDIANQLSISRESAKVTANRYVKQELLLRLKNNFYIASDKFEALKEDDLFYIANLLQVPSYISLASALSYYNISTQQLQDTIESVAFKRTKYIKARETEFKFILIKKSLYTGFTKQDNFFIALPEKALADAVYLTSLGKYNCDFNAIDFSKVNKAQVDKYIKKTNRRTKVFWDNLCKLYKI